MTALSVQPATPLGRAARFPSIDGMIDHPLLEKAQLHARGYQIELAEACIEENCLLVLPTGLGKTAIAALVVAELARCHPGSKIVVMAPTRPLVAQHARTFASLHPRLRVGVLAGSQTSEKRADEFQRGDLLVTTPQGFARDVADRRIDLAHVALLVVDEAHRAVGDYAYVSIAQAYRSAHPQGRIVGLTASPGHTSDRIAEVARNLSIERIEARTLSDADIQDHVQDSQLELRSVRLTSEMEAFRDRITAIRISRLAKLRAFLPRSVPANRIGKGAILAIGDTIRARLQKRDGRKGFLFAALLHQGVALHADHALELFETQGPPAFASYLAKMARTPQPSRSERAFRRELELLPPPPQVEHPKHDLLMKTLEDSLASNPTQRILVFAQYRDTVRHIVDSLAARHIAAERFVGQADREADEGMSQDEQARVLGRFSDASTRILVATSVAEEGLHIPDVDLVIFYEPIPSEIRAIQRRGRTGRTRAGRVLVLYTEQTRDEAFLHAERHREGDMHRLVEHMRNPNLTSRPSRPGRLDPTDHKGDRSRRPRREGPRVTPARITRQTEIDEGLGGPRIKAKNAPGREKDERSGRRATTPTDVPNRPNRSVLKGEPTPGVAKTRRDTLPLQRPARTGVQQRLDALRAALAASVASGTAWPVGEQEDLTCGVRKGTPPSTGRRGSHSAHDIPSAA
ncbi:MAG: DEAD/DEAH box helicase [Thermoplasmatota archaeon]